MSSVSSPGPMRHCGLVHGNGAANGSGAAVVAKSLVYEICHPLVMENPASSFSGYSSCNATAVSSNCAETALMTGNGI